MTTLVKYHRKTTELALFESDGEYWVGAFSPHTQHQNGEPPYYYIAGYWKTEREGLDELTQMTGEEF